MKVFTIYGHCGDLGHVTWTICTKFGSPFPRRFRIKFGFDWPSGFRGEDLSQVAQRATIAHLRTSKYFQIVLK